MSTKKKSSPESIVRDIKRKTRRKFTAEEKIRIVLVGLRGEESISDLCRREGIHPTMYYKWSKAFLEAGKRQLTGDTVREAGSEEVKELRAEYEKLTTFNPSNDDRRLVYPKHHYNLARLYEQKGWVGKAIDHYEKFLDLWKDADPGIPEVEDAMERLAELLN